MEMNKRKIPFSPPDISELEIEEVAKALRSGWITTGPRTKELERRLAEFCHTSKVVCLNSATAAEELNLRVCGIQEGDEVIVPAYTYTASASAAIHCGAKVIFVDSQKDNCEMDYDKVAEAITEKTKAVVAVDLGGVICDYDKLYQAIESKKNLFTPRNDNTLGSRIQKTLNRVMVFADCAHALGSVVQEGCVISAGAVVNYGSMCARGVHVECDAVVASGTLVPACTKVQSCTVVYKENIDINDLFENK